VVLSLKVLFDHHLGRLSLTTGTEQRDWFELIKKLRTFPTVGKVLLEERANGRAPDAASSCSGKDLLIHEVAVTDLKVLPASSHLSLDALVEHKEQPHHFSALSSTHAWLGIQPSAQDGCLTVFDW
jgi:hypothetical protein